LGNIGKGANKIIWNRKNKLIKKNENEFRDSVYVENLTNLYMEIMRENTDIRDSNAYLSREMTNMQGIYERDKVNQKACLTAEVAKHLLDLSDHMGRIRDAAEKSSSVEAILDGMQMINKEMEKVLVSLQIQKQNPIGQIYDPNLYELGGMKTLDGFESNIIVEVLRDGFVCNKRVIRPALVLVNVKKDSTNN